MKCPKCKINTKGITYTYFSLYIGQNINGLCRNCWEWIFRYGNIPDHIPEEQHKRYLLQKEL